MMIPVDMDNGAKLKYENDETRYKGRSDEAANKASKGRGTDLRPIESRGGEAILY